MFAYDVAFINFASACLQLNEVDMPLSCLSKIYQRGLSEAQNGYGFGMLPGHGLPDGQFSSLVFDGSPACKLFTAPELENLLMGHDNASLSFPGKRDAEERDDASA